ncbi:helix-turn-helix transcriptional regulator [Sphingomonas cannabina]|uniref:helix-turn-helix domain-containing protein n=1 Tax=Sphingomonas cannabina TaxID=2899123 RepID=UPI001F1B5D07|nr:helix-turn-helix transcriptional regulator [Sphingomonas cannabina]UIJ44730.1 helix-turn-helix transcriptional regulator [Sphingomonas cannabina]
MRGPDEVDLGRLNQAEREALGLLGEGHTAKSIAALTGRSVGAVNERLREARRKTGVGSSRELARLLKAQENRDEQIGVAGSDRGGASTPSEAAAAGAESRNRRSIYLMAGIGTILLGATGLALAIGTSHQPSPFQLPIAPADQDTGELAPLYKESPSPGHWHTLVKAETRDERWAPEAEEALRAHYAAIPDLDTPQHKLTVYCAKSLCEVTAVLNSDPGQEIGRTMVVVQKRSLEKPADLALTNRFVGFRASAERSQQTLFAAYWQRGN